MAEFRPFSALRYTPRVDPSLAIAPPYDVISPRLQAQLYDRSPDNIIRVELGEGREGDGETENRYTRASATLQAWHTEGVLAADVRPAFYVYDQTFNWAGRAYTRRACFGAVRLEPWEAGIVKPHEHTLSQPKADRLELLRATRTQVSPVYSVFRSKGTLPDAPAETLMDFEADGQRHVLSAITDADSIEAIAAVIEPADVYIADGHHRYETALAFRDEVRARTSSWTDDEPENFVLMALTDVRDRGLLVLPTHRMINPPAWPENALDRLSWHFQVEDLGHADVGYAAGLLASAGRETAAFVATGLEPSAVHLLTLSDRGSVEALMPRDRSAAWKALDVNVLQYGVLQDVFGIDDAMLRAGGVVEYTQDARDAANAVSSGGARCSFLLNATPVSQVMAVADAGGRMPQKSTYFYPKLPTGLVMRALDQ